MSVREAKQSPMVQGTAESIAYIFEFSTWGTPSSPTTTILDTSTNTDVSSTCLDSDTSDSVSGTQVTTKRVQSLTANHRYMLLCTVTIGTNTESGFLYLDAE